MPRLGPASSGHNFYIQPGVAADGTADVPAIDVSVTRTDGADDSTSSVDPLVAVSVSRTDGADASASAVDTLVAVSVARTGGADDSAGSVAPVVAVSVARTDGADTADGQVAPLVAVSAANTDGADVSAAVVEPVAGSIDAAVAVTEGADLFAAAVAPVEEEPVEPEETPVSGGGGGYAPKRLHGPIGRELFANRVYVPDEEQPEAVLSEQLAQDNAARESQKAASDEQQRQKTLQRLGLVDRSLAEQAQALAQYEQIQAQLAQERADDDEIAAVIALLL